MWNFQADYDYNPEANELRQDIDNAGEWFDKVTAILYGKEEFDLIQLEDALEELGCYLKRKIPMNPLNLQKNEE